MTSKQQRRRPREIVGAAPVGQAGAAAGTGDAVSGLFDAFAAALEREGATGFAQKLIEKSPVSFGQLLTSFAHMKDAKGPSGPVKIECSFPPVGAPDSDFAIFAVAEENIRLKAELEAAAAKVKTLEKERGEPGKGSGVSGSDVFPDVRDLPAVPAQPLPSDWTCPTCSNLGIPNRKVAASDAYCPFCNCDKAGQVDQPGIPGGQAAVGLCIDADGSSAGWELQHSEMEP